MEVVFSRVIRENSRQPQLQQGVFVVRLQFAETLLEILIDGDGLLPENERVGDNVIEYRLLLFLDRVLQSAHSLRVRNLDWKDTLVVITKQPTVQFKHGHWNVQITTAL